MSSEKATPTYRYIPVWRRERAGIALYRCFEIPGVGFTIQSKDFYWPGNFKTVRDEHENRFLELLIEDAPDTRTLPQPTLEEAIRVHEADFEWWGAVQPKPDPDALDKYPTGGLIEARLRALGLELPAPKPPVANYLGTKRSASLLFVSGRVSGLRGAVGVDVTLEQAREAARDTVLDLLAIVKQDLKDLDHIFSVEMVRGFVRSAPDFVEQPRVIDGASDLLIALWEERGRHARTATGVSQLPGGACVQVEMIVRLT